MISKSITNCMVEDLKILRFQRETPHTSNCPTVAVFRFKVKKKHISGQN